MTPHEIDDADPDGRADIGKDFGGFTRRRGLGDGGKRIAHALSGP